MRYHNNIIYVSIASQTQYMFHLYAASKRQVLNFFLKYSKLSLFRILNSNLFHSRGGSIVKRSFSKVFYKGCNKVYLVISSQLSLVFPTSNKVRNILWCNGMVGFICCIHNSLLDKSEIHLLMLSIANCGSFNLKDKYI